MSWENLWEILTVTTFWELLLIFTAKIVEVAIGTLRGILIVKGYRTPGVLLSLIEIIIWIFVASRVITGLADSPMKGIAYALGFSAGVFVGSLLEQKLAFGKLLIQTITTDKKGGEIATILREQGYGVTIVDGTGKVEKRSILMVYTHRRGSSEIIKTILAIDPSAMIIQNDVSTLVGGFIHSGKSLIK
ncbi:MAG: DUF5698 domain-containing protein [Candidatus Izemoplasmatales bacterium]|jgi:uncharacterized protein YebE (UPF0316 family)|nr:DUF5698 domain-containing protein [Candidatus Izemoplasmatales bacterium]